MEDPSTVREAYRPDLVRKKWNGVVPYPVATKRVTEVAQEKGLILPVLRQHGQHHPVLVPLTVSGDVLLVCLQGPLSPDLQSDQVSLSLCCGKWQRSLWEHRW
jgi:hypothetical protein